jgi:two-component system, cell cycle sensor histidine kinase and response regulator CckA
VAQRELSERIAELRERLGKLPPNGDGELPAARDELLAMTDELASLHAELALELTGHKEALLESAVDGVVTIDEQGLIETFNQAAATMFGWAPEEVIGSNVKVLMPSPYQEEHDGYLQAYRETGRQRIIGIGREVRGLRKDGTEFPLDLGVSEIHVGGRRRFLGILRDITARREAEDALRRERDVADGLIETIPAIVLILDLEGRIVRFNRFLAELSGWELSEVAGRSWFTTFLAEPDRARIWSTFEAVVEQTPVGAQVDTIVLRDGSTRTIEWYNTVLHGEQDDARGVLAIGLDISERLRLQQEFLQLQKLEAVGRLASGIAHDFNNLLMGIMGCSTLATRKLEPNSPARTYLEEIRSGAERGAALTRQLLDFSRRRPARPQLTAVNAAVRTTHQMLRQLIGADVTLHIQLSDQDPRVIVDAGQVEQILMNLATNACDAMPKGGELFIRTRVEPTGDVVLEVVDTGEGMDEATRERAFEPFFTTKGPDRGTGLGLSTVFGIVQRAGGRVELHSEPGRGTAIALHFPRALLEPQPAAPAGVSHETVLVVEDERLVRLAVRAYLEDAGFRVLEAETPERALELVEKDGGAAEGHVDLLLTDVRLPGMGGDALARAILAKRPRLPVLFMSAYPPAELRDQGLLPVGAHAVQKPVSAEALVAAVR